MGDETRTSTASGDTAARRPSGTTDEAGREVTSSGAETGGPAGAGAEGLRDAPVAVVGAGLTGASWAGLYAAAGLEVRLHDVDGALLEAAVERAAAAAGFLAGSGLADLRTAERGVDLLGATTDLAKAVAGVQHVQECVREDLALKREVFAAIDAAAPADALICTSTSGLSISEIQTAAARPERCLAAHPYNPPHLVPLVELAPGALTAPEALERAAVFYAAVGKVPVKLTRDLPGYLANRLSAALWREAVDLVLRGVATVDDVDRAVSYGPGLRWAAMGPHLLYDLGGGQDGIRGHIEHLAAVKEGMLRDLATWTTFPPDTGTALEAGLAEEKEGRDHDELAAQRDALLVAYLRARRELDSR
jgi:carnitine 3-dehydrogenase